MTEKQRKAIFQRCATTDSVSVEEPDLPNPDIDCLKKMRKSVSMDIGEAEVVKKTIASNGFCRRRCIRRKSSGRPEPEFGHETETYEKIRERVLQERAVTNAIDALQKRWKMILFMYDDCVGLNETRRVRKLRKLSTKQQFELVVIVSLFFLVCLPISVVFVSINK